MGIPTPQETPDSGHFLQILYRKLPIAQTCRVFVEGESG